MKLSITGASKFTIGTIPDGNSQTVGVVERYADLLPNIYSGSQYSGLYTHHGQDRFHWGYAQWAPVYGQWQGIGKVALFVLLVSRFMACSSSFLRGRS